MANTLNLGTDGNWGTKENSLLGYNSENDNFKPLPFDFTRASNATRVNKAGLIETVGNGIPRIDFLGNTEGALLLEPQRTNLITYSEDFSDSSWAKNGALTVTSNASTSPSGETNATLLYSIGSENRISQNASVVNGNTYTLSAYLKNNGGNNTISFEVIGYSSKSITITNEWARYDFTITATSTAILQFRFLSFDSNVNLYIYGAQVEQGSYPTSYIKTEGSAVTRLADSCLQGGFQDKNIFGSTQGSAVFEFKWDASNYVFDFNDSSGIRIRIFRGTTSWLIRDFSGASWISNGFTNLSNVKTKIGFKWNGTEFTAFQDGVKSSSTDSFASSMSIESITTNKLNNTSNMQFYNTALTDQELQALTTL